MSLGLDVGTFPEGLEVKTFDSEMVLLGDYRISIGDFCEMVKYVLTNADLAVGDPRIELVQVVQNMAIVSGHSRGSRKLQVMK